jgi:two-component system sensor histidine kinase BaeS
VTAEPRNRRFSPLGLRLVVSFVTVAVVAVLVLSGLMLLRTRNTVEQLAADRQQASAVAVADVLALDYSAAGGWSANDSHSAAMLALQAGASLRVRDPSGHEVDLGMSQMHLAAPAANGVVRSAPVIVDGKSVGTAELVFTRGELQDAEIHVRTTLWTTTIFGAALATFLSLAVAIPLARRVTKPITELRDATGRLGAGDPTARAGHHHAPGELGQLAVTFDRMADTLQTQDRARRGLIADVAHELRTPVTLLEGNCEEVIDGLADPTVERFVAMHDDVLRLRRIIEDLAALADADDAAGQLQILSSPVDIAVVAAAAVDSARGLAEAKSLLLSSDLQPARVQGDANRLRQIVTNLLTNAIKFTPTGGTITVRTAPTADGESVRLDVIDNGPGIGEVDLGHIFERFYRADTARGISGSGVGLAVVDQLVRAHHGTVTATNQKPHGTEFTVELPAASAAIADPPIGPTQPPSR